VFTNFDLVVVPTTRLLPPKINDSLALEAKGGGPGAPPTRGKVYDWFPPTGGCANTSPFDAYGVPAISLPCGFSEGGLPIGLMIAGPHFSVGKILALAYAYQQATQWHTKKPPLTASTVVPPIVEAANPTVESK
jgi:aspartyl-tRNA(Asn)/glutamyl-tRNA(Gln) amidotransferase subunit A